MREKHHYLKFCLIILISLSAKKKNKKVGMIFFSNFIIGRKSIINREITNFILRVGLVSSEHKKLFLKKKLED